MGRRTTEKFGRVWGMENMRMVRRIWWKRCFVSLFVDIWRERERDITARRTRKQVIPPARETQQNEKTRKRRTSKVKKGVRRHENERTGGHNVSKEMRKIRVSKEN